MKDYQLMLLLGAIMLHLYYTGSERPIAAAVLAAVCAVTSAFLIIISKIDKDV